MPVAGHQPGAYRASQGRFTGAFDAAHYLVPADDDSKAELHSAVLTNSKRRRFLAAALLRARETWFGGGGEWEGLQWMLLSLSLSRQSDISARTCKRRFVATCRKTMHSGTASPLKAALSDPNALGNDEAIRAILLRHPHKCMCCVWYSEHQSPPVSLVAQ